MSIAIGEVISVKGVNIVVELYEESNKETLFFNGEKFNGVSIREHILIKRGFRDIVTLVQGEYLDDGRVTDNGMHHVRRVELKPIGFYHNGLFSEGVKYLPMIRDIAFLMSETQVRQVYGEQDDQFVIGELLKEGLSVSLPWAKLFNTHIGVFGNTGSGKSNTLANLYTTLFRNKHREISSKSNFTIIDFNGEYTGDQLLPRGEKKNIIDLNTKSEEGDKFLLSEHDFWDSEVFGILFKATENTQKPFLKRLVSGRNRFRDSPGSLATFTTSVLSRALTSTSPKKEFADIISEIATVTGAEQLAHRADRLSWHGVAEKFKFNGDFLNGGDHDYAYTTHFKPLINALQVDGLTHFSELQLRVHVQLLADLISGFVQFDYIQPLLKRMEASLQSLERVFTVGNNPDDRLLTVVSLRKCNQEVKKVIPLLLAKYYYNKHKQAVLNASPPSKTFHLIIDEAHNILSTQSTREHESWKDYRLELFEEIVKEGRKFGFFLTLSSQRPADISPTIMSQLHNFFIHRLVNDRDILLLENSMNTLDSLSRSMIPNLAKGCAIVTGTSFDLPMVVQFEKLPRVSQPDSDDVDLNELWRSD